MTSKVEISHRTIIFTLVLLLGLWLLVQIRDILYLLLISFILMSALRPLVDGLEKIRIPRIIAILFLYGLIFGVLGASLASTIPSLVVQSSKLIQILPEVVQRVLPYVDINVQSLTQQITPIGENLVKVTVGIFSNVITLVTVLVFTFYFLLERRYTQDFLVGLMGENSGRRVAEVVARAEKRLGTWVLGEIFLMVFIGVVVYLGLTFLRVEYALPLAIIAGLLEIVPMVGPIVSAVPAVLVALASSPLLAASVVALYFIVQQVENSLVVPWVMKKSVGMSPILTILALLVGGRLAGIVGAILAVPLVLVIQEVIVALPSQSERKK